MKKIALIIILFLLSGLLSNEEVVLANDSSNTITVNDPVDFLLITEDLLPGCEWQPTPIVTRQVADGSLTFTEFFCGKDPYTRRISQMIFITAREFQPGDGNYYISLRDIGTDDSLVNVGSWATKLRTMYDHSAITFTKQNVLVYIADGSGDSKEEIQKLAEISADRIPDQIVPVLTPSDNSGQSVEQEFLDNITVAPPTFVFDKMGEDLPIMNRSSDIALGKLSFSAEFTEPRQAIVEVYSQNSEYYLARWILPVGIQPAYALDKVLKPSPIIDVDYANDLFFEIGTYYTLVTVDGKVINRTEYRIE